MTVGLLSFGTSSIPPYLGSVATRTAIPTGAGGGGADMQFNCRTGHFMRASTSAMAVGFANFFMQDNVLGNGQLVKASIEYPAGTFQRVTWGGNATLTVSQTITLSDLMPISIPKGNQFWIRYFVDGTPAGGCPLGREYAKNLSMGDAIELAASGLSDRTMSGSVPDNGDPQTNFQSPLLVGYITEPSVAIIGDSIAYGNNDLGDTTGDVGAVARAIGAHFGYTNSAVPGDQATQYLALHTYRAQLAQYCSHIFLQYGTNDFFLGHRTAAQLASDLAGIRALFPGKPFIQSTISPNTSTPGNPDHWTTLGGQVVLDATDEAQRVIYNDSVRAGISGVTHFNEAADVMESSRNSGKWKVDGSTLNLSTSDGIHPSPLVYQNLISTINTAWFTYP